MLIVNRHVVGVHVFVQIVFKLENMAEVQSVVFFARSVVDVVENDEALGSVNAGMVARARIQVDSIQVHSVLVGSIVTTRHSVRVQHGNELENEVLAQRSGTWIVFTQDELEEPVEDERGRCFARMNAARENIDPLLVESVAALLSRRVVDGMRKEVVRVEARLVLETELITTADGYQIDTFVIA